MSRAGPLQQLFRSWETEIARPILVAVLTAFALFLFSLAFRPVRSFLFPVDAGYPLLCRTEAYGVPGDQELHVEVYVVNRSDERFTWEELNERLAERASGADASPDLTFRFARDEGWIERAAEDASFNKDKGSIVVAHQRRELSIRIGYIEPRAILKAVAVVVGLPERSGGDGAEVTRGTPGANPLDASSYLDACYSR